jgi:glycosyltransferase involved in cell wall biosynthesis
MEANAKSMELNERFPLVSIIIPCYNRARYLPEAIQSALSQTHLNIEVVIVNDGSVDNTAEVAARYPTLRYLEQANRGVAEARNSGFEVSKGDYVQFLDADDRLTPQSVESHLRCFREHPGVGFVVGDIEWINEEGRCFGKANSALLRSNHYEELLKVNHVANTIATLFDRSVFRKIGGFNGFFSPAEDFELLLRAARTFPSAHHSTVVAQYRRHTTNTSRRGVVMLKATNRVILAERQLVKGDCRLETALRKGDQHWRDFFGGVTIKEIYSHLGRRDLASAARATAGLVWYVRGRIFIIPWKYRRRAMAAARRRLQRLRKRLLSRPFGGTVPRSSARCDTRKSY